MAKMSHDNDLEFYPALFLKWKVDARNRNTADNAYTYSSQFMFQGAERRLAFRFYENVFYLHFGKLNGKCFEPFDVVVDVENGTNQILPELKCHEHWGKASYYDLFWRFISFPLIWKKTVADVVEGYPEFGRNNHELRFQVVLKSRSALVEGVKFAATQTEDFESHAVPTTTSTLASAAGESSGTAPTSIELQNTPYCLASLSQDFSKMLDQGTDTDVEFQCGAHTTRAHGAVVSARSEVIATMLASDMVEGATRVVKIPNMEHEVFKHFLRYIYTGQLPVLTVDLALDLYESGDQYAVLGLAKRCSQYLLEHLTVQNSHQVLMVADAHANAELKEAAIDFMVVNRVPRVSDHWKDFCRAHPMLAIEVLDRFCL